MKYTLIAALIGRMYRTARPTMTMSGQAYINGGGLANDWRVLA